MVSWKAAATRKPVGVKTSASETVVIQIDSGAGIPIGPNLVELYREYTREYVRVHEWEAAERAFGVARTTLWYWNSGSRIGYRIPKVLIQTLGTDMEEIEQHIQSLRDAPTHPGPTALEEASPSADDLAEYQWLVELVGLHDTKSEVASLLGVDPRTLNEGLAGPILKGILKERVVTLRERLGDSLSSGTPQPPEELAAGAHQEVSAEENLDLPPGDNDVVSTDGGEEPVVGYGMTQAETPETLTPPAFVLTPGVLYIEPEPGEEGWLDPKVAFLADRWRYLVEEWTRRRHAGSHSSFEELVIREEMLSVEIDLIDGQRMTLAPSMTPGAEIVPWDDLNRREQASWRQRELVGVAAARAEAQRAAERRARFNRRLARVGGGVVAPFSRVGESWGRSDAKRWIATNLFRRV